MVINRLDFPFISDPTSWKRTYLVLANAVGRVLDDPGPRHTVYPRCPLPLSFVVFPPSYAPVVDKEHNRPVHQIQQKKQ